MADEDTGLTDQVISAVSEYVGDRTGEAIQTTLRSMNRASIAEFTCKIPSDLHAHLRRLMVADGTGMATQVVRAVREYVSRKMP